MDKHNATLLRAAKGEPKMPNEMVERVAKVIRETSSRFLSKVEADQMARAAIEAMREPTDSQRNHYFVMRKATGCYVQG